MSLDIASDTLTPDKAQALEKRLLHSRSGVSPKTALLTTSHTPSSKSFTPQVQHTASAS
jgi:hypothetical protein